MAELLGCGISPGMARGVTGSVNDLPSVVGRRQPSASCTAPAVMTRGVTDNH